MSVSIKLNREIAALLNRVAASKNVKVDARLLCIDFVSVEHGKECWALGEDDVRAMIRIAITCAEEGMIR